MMFVFNGAINSSGVIFLLVKVGNLFCGVYYSVMVLLYIIPAEKQQHLNCTCLHCHIISQISSLWQTFYLYNAFIIWLNPIDPNSAVAARAVCPQSGRSRPEKRPFFHIFPHFSKIEQSKKVLPHIGVQYIKLKPMKFKVKCKRNRFVLISRYALVRI